MATWNERDHPRHPSGSSQGGEFRNKGGARGATQTYPDGSPEANLIKRYLQASKAQREELDIEIDARWARNADIAIDTISKRKDGLDITYENGTVSRLRIGSGGIPRDRSGNTVFPGLGPMEGAGKPSRMDLLAQTGGPSVQDLLGRAPKTKTLRSASSGVTFKSAVSPTGTVSRSHVKPTWKKYK